MTLLAKRLSQLFILLGLTAIAFATSSFASIPMTATSLAPMLAKALPAVVNIRADIKITDLTTLYQLQKQRGGDLGGNIPDTFLSVASGVVVNKDKGYILTNAHVVNDAQNITVTLGDGRHFTAKLIGLDKASDIGLLQIKAKNLTEIAISNSNNLKVGDVLAAIGNPYGLNQSVTSGIVSALGRTSLGIENIENFIQTDAPINPGNSGGALIDTNGQLIGINTAILAPDRGSVGIGFAVPSNIAHSVMQQLIQFGDVKRGVLGIGAQDITPDLAEALSLSGDDAGAGAVVTMVKENSPADKAGIKVGDVIKQVDTSDIHNANDVVSTIGFLRVNSKINIALLRNNKRMNVNATLIDPMKLKDINAATDPFFYGVGLKNFSLLSSIHGQIRGVLVVSVDQDSHAWQADVRPGDVITSVNQQAITNIADLKKMIVNAKSTLLLNVLRGPGAVFLVVNKEEY